ncbi:MAG TPA: hypothetical protein VKT33_09925 [Candidatus Angelobacter sp.]|nr:hypothetical protein [Candidatus Angelobacter sp.]
MPQFYAAAPFTRFSLILKTRKQICLQIVLLALLSISALPQSVPGTEWDALRALEGKWVGEGSSELGQGSGYFTLEPDLQGKVWVRRNHSEYPAGKERPAYTHEDLMIVYFDSAAKRTRAFYQDTEGHTIQYAVTAAGHDIIFLSDPQPGAPRFRLTYSATDPAHMTVALEMAQPGKPDDFHKIVEGKVRKVTPY